MYDVFKYFVLVIFAIGILRKLMKPFFKVFKFFKKKNWVKSSEKKGKIGEKRVEKYLGKLSKKNNKLVVYNDLLIKDTNGRSTQIDHLAILGNQVLVIETKNYGGVVIGNNNKKDWQIIYPDGSLVFQYNSFEQNKGHIDFLKKAINDSHNYNFLNYVAMPGKNKDDYSVVGGVKEGMGIISSYKDLLKAYKSMKKKTFGKMPKVELDKIKEFENYTQLELAEHISYVKSIGK